MTKLKKEEVMRATNIRGTNRLQIQFLNGASYHQPNEEGSNYRTTFRSW